jgi:hypothetical protein
VFFEQVGVSPKHLNYPIYPLPTAGGAPAAKATTPAAKATATAAKAAAKATDAAATEPGKAT